MTDFELHPQLKQDTYFMGELELCIVLLMNDARFPWLIMVPKKTDATELCDLSQDELYQLSLEIKTVSVLLQEIYHPDKLNVASLGNIVSQLHIHIVARYQTDTVWPKSVFGQGNPVPYSVENLAAILESLKNHFLVMKTRQQEKTDE